MAAAADDSILRVVDAIGALIEFWGFKRNMGRAWTLLYLQPAPLSAADIADRLSISAGATSMTLTELQKWGVIKKAWVPGERRDYFEPEISIWKMVSRVFRERELTQIHAAGEVFDAAIAALSDERKRATGPDRQRLRFVLERIESLRGLARIGETLLRSILSGQAVDAGPLQTFKPEAEAEAQAEAQAEADVDD